MTSGALAGAARRLSLLCAGAELARLRVMDRRLGELGQPYREGAGGNFSQAARGLTVAGALLLGARAQRSRAAAVLGGGMMLAGAVCERWSVFKAGFQSARDPRYTVAPQRRRMAEGHARASGAAAAAAGRNQ